MNYIPHLTTEGERWDSLAWRYYGDAHAYERIIQANPGLPLMTTLPGGLTLAIPVVESDEVATSEALPPWKR